MQKRRARWEEKETTLGEREKSSPSRHCSSRRDDSVFLFPEKWESHARGSLNVEREREKGKNETRCSDALVDLCEPRAAVADASCVS